MVDISVVTGTRERLRYLKEMVESVRIGAAFAGLTHEIVVVDAGSTDNTGAWCLDQPDVVLIQQGRPLGCVRAFNAGFAVAQAKYVFNVNDDCVIVGEVMGAAFDQLEGGPSVGQVAIPFRQLYDTVSSYQCTRPIAGKKWLMANWGITRKSLGDALGWWNGYDHYAGDYSISMKIWASGSRVSALNSEGYILHLELQDATRQPNLETEKFYERWQNWTPPQ